MRRTTPIALLLVCSLLTTLGAALCVPPATHAQGPRAERQAQGKLTQELRARFRRALPGSGERTRVILSLSDDAAAARMRVALQAAGANVRRELSALGVMVADVPVDKLEDLAAQAEVSWLSEDGEVRSLATPDNTSHIEVTTGANQVLPSGNSAQADGGAGNGIGIAVLDSGISPSDAAEFAGYRWQSGLLGLTSTLEPYDRLKKSIDFTGEGRTDDPYGHGTHTAGVAAGTGQSSESYAAEHPGAATYGGIATGANLINVRVLNGQGVGTVSNVIAGLNWVIQNRVALNIRVVNLSLGAPITQSYKTDPLCQAVGRAVDAGLVVVVAAGNWGKDSNGSTIYGGILSPANSPKAITVGATNTQQTDRRSDDVVTTYSSRGPTLVDGLVKPDLVAPGNRIGAAQTANSATSSGGSTSASSDGGGLIGGLLGTLSLGGSSTPSADGTYQILSGTSFAAPAVSGTVALMLEANPSLTPGIVKAILMRTAQRLPVYEAMVMRGQMTPFERIITEGAGQLNANAARRVASAIRHDADTAKPGENLLLNKKVTYSTINGLTSPIAGESVALNNGVLWVEGVAFNERMQLTSGYRLTNGQVIYDGFA
ncbi:MAG TPA: S8 family peptidase, partial [Pyrinomonadaceae bacterium]